MGRNPNYSSPAWRQAGAKLSLESIAELVRKNGPIRVIVDAEGLGEQPQRAQRRPYYEPPVVVFIRNDGWTLGACAKYEAVARKLWEKDWVGVLRNGPAFDIIEDLRPK